MHARLEDKKRIFKNIDPKILKIISFAPSTHPEKIQQAAKNKAMKKFAFFLFLYAAQISILYYPTTKYQGEFNWERIIMEDNYNPKTGLSFTERKVHASLENSEKIFFIENKDMCFYLKGEHWLHRDGKDTGIAIFNWFEIWKSAKLIIRSRCWCRKVFSNCAYRAFSSHSS